MSGRFQTHTVVPDGAELDESYQKTVADIEEQTLRSGWLFGRGAFDKADLQYLRDFNNSLRYKEVEIEDKEKELWERERARLEAEAAAAASEHAAAALKRRSSGGSGAVAGAAAGPVRPQGPGSQTARPAPLLLPVKVKPVGSRQQTTPQPRTTSPSAAGEPASSCKRLRTADGRGATTGGQLSPPAAPITSARSEPALRNGGSSGAGAAVAGHQASTATAGSGRNAAGAAPLPAERERVQAGRPAEEAGLVRPYLGRSVSAPMGTPAAAMGGTEGPGGSGTGGTGLANLLGGYGSDGDSEDDSEAPTRHKERAGTGAGAGAGAGPDRTEAVGLGNGSKALDGGSVQRLQEAGSAGPRTAPGPGPAAAKLPPPVGLLSPEELLNDPRVINEGLVATRPVPQAVQGGDAWDSEEASGSESD